MKLEFIGAINDVTGSMTLLEVPEGKLLIDSGLYQGISSTTKRNLHPLPFDPKTLSAVILTHAHLDHSGFIPRLVRLGFRGEIYCTKPTMKLATIIMSDSARLMEDEKNVLRNFYEIKDVVAVSSFFRTKKYNESFKVLGLDITFIPAGHILGASSVIIKNKKTVVFSGDLGRFDDPLIPAPSLCPETDLLIMESTYGGKNRVGKLEEELHQFLRKIKKESKVGIIASFAVARSQLLITLITEFYKKYPEEKVRFVTDGPMMSEANKIYQQFADETKLPDEVKFSLSHCEIIEHSGEWESLSKKQGPLVIVASSGMLTGGRIWRYLENWQDDETACLFLAGYQAEGTPGRALSEGIRTIHSEEGKTIRWLGEVKTSMAFSSHADQSELIKWTMNLNKETTIYLNHGERDSKIKLKEKLNSLGFSNVVIAGSGDIIDIGTLPI